MHAQEKAPRKPYTSDQSLAQPETIKNKSKQILGNDFQSYHIRLNVQCSTKYLKAYKETVNYSSFKGKK